MLDSHFEHALMQDFPCMLLFNIHFCSCEIQTNSHYTQIFRVGVRTKKATKHIGNHWQKKWAVTNNKKCTNGFGNSRDAHKYCYIVRVSILANLLAGVTSCTDSGFHLAPGSSILVVMKAARTLSIQHFHPHSLIPHPTFHIKKDWRLITMTSSAQCVCTLQFVCAYKC